MNCPSCNNEVPAAARFCPHCGERIDTAPAGDLSSRARRVRTPARGCSACYSLALIGSLAVVAGCFLPWYRIGSFVGRGYDEGDGYIVMGIGLVASGLAIYGLISRRGWLRFFELIAAMGALGFGVRLAIDIAHEASAWRVSVNDFLGIPVILAGAILVGVASVMSLAKKKR